MKRYIVVAIFVFALLTPVRSQVLDVSEVIQEQNQWCWAAVTECVLDFYGHTREQCELADYTRRVATWHDFGETNCCYDPTQGCNYWNYNWGYNGSVQDLLVRFGDISNSGVGSALNRSEVVSNIESNRPFIIRWGWESGGGHFIVGHGLLEDKLYYMDPWYGEGLKIADFSWVSNSDNHTWTHTNVLNVSPTNVIEPEPVSLIKAYPNPAFDQLMLETTNVGETFSFYIFNIIGEVVYEGSFTDKTTLDISGFSPGVYVIRLENNLISRHKKIIVQ